MLKTKPLLKTSKTSKLDLGNQTTNILAFRLTSRSAFCWKSCCPVSGAFSSCDRRVISNSVLPFFVDMSWNLSHAPALASHKWVDRRVNRACKVLIRHNRRAVSICHLRVGLEFHGLEHWSEMYPTPFYVALQDLSSSLLNCMWATFLAEKLKQSGATFRAAGDPEWAYANKLFVDRSIAIGFSPILIVISLCGVTTSRTLSHRIRSIQTHHS